MTQAALPAAIQAFIDATNAADSDAFVAAFTRDAYLSDWGREFHGHDGVRAWNSTDNIGVHSHFEFVEASAGEQPDTHIVTLR
jgi:ketosteroid isomerase-like protein